jgi:pimeloyl-ACP methyl ester carboxylesterase
VNVSALNSVVQCKSPTATVRVLRPIWECVLQRTPIGPDDNFFDLGGDPELSVKLFSQIAEALGRELPPTAIYEAPTISALANLLDHRAPRPLSPLVLLKPGAAERSPAFIAHGLGSSVMEFFELMKHMRTSCAIYGLQAKGSDSADRPLTHIEDRARSHLDAIRRVRAHGPYTLIGYSLGGLIAFEMACQLCASGEEIGLLAMIDSYPRTESLALRARVQRTITQLGYRVSDAVRSLRWGVPHTSLLSRRERTRFADFLAWTRYQPSFYSGKVRFVRAEKSHYPDPGPIWAGRAIEFAIETTTGDHHTILSTHSADLACVLSGYLENT